MTVVKLGERLIETGKLSEDGMRQALGEQVVTGQSFGQVLLDLELVTIADVLEVVVEQKRQQMEIGGRLGDLLVESGKATRRQIGRAHALQRSSGRLLGEVLLEEGVITDAELAAILVQQEGPSSAADRIG
jgi:hypothetical protein